MKTKYIKKRPNLRRCLLTRLESENIRRIRVLFRSKTSRLEGSGRPGGVKLADVPALGSPYKAPEFFEAFPVPEDEARGKLNPKPVVIW